MSVRTFDPRPEVRLLILCARTRLAPEVAGQIRELLAAELDWNYVIRAALHHGLMPLLCHHLGAVAPEAVLPPAWEHLQRLFHTNACQNLVLTTELLRLLTLFESHGIAAIPYKGPALAVTLYGDLSLRQFDDLDILIGQQDALEAAALLRAQNYRPLFSLPPRKRAIFLRREMAFVHPNGRNIVELHWGITERHFTFARDAGDFRDRLQPVSLGERTVLGLSPDDSAYDLD